MIWKYCVCVCAIRLQTNHQYHPSARTSSAIKTRNTLFAATQTNRDEWVNNKANNDDKRREDFGYSTTKIYRMVRRKISCNSRLVCFRGEKKNKIANPKKTNFLTVSAHPQLGLGTCSKKSTNCIWDNCFWLTESFSISAFVFKVKTRRWENWFFFSDQN